MSKNVTSFPIIFSFCSLEQFCNASNGWITGHTGGTIFFKPHQMVPDLLIYYDSSKYTPIDGTEAVVYGTFGGVVVGDTYCMDGYYFENLN